MTGIYSAHTQLETYRQLFPALANKAYFNFGGQGPIPQAALDAIFHGYKQIQQVGPFSNAASTWIIQEVKQIRALIAAELNVSAETICLTEDVTVGCNIALWGISWQPGDHVLITDCEHPGVVAAVEEIQRRFGIEVSCCQLQETLNEGDPAAVIAQHLRPNTRLVVLSHILWNTGQVLPLAEIVVVCRQHSERIHGSTPVQILVDAAQSVGVLPLDLTQLGVDFYAFTGHKWWCGPEGVGGLYVRPEALESLHPTFIGWRGVVYNSAGQPVSWHPDARRYEVATSAYPLYAGLRAAITMHQQWGTAQERYQRIQQLSAYLWQQLNEVPHIHCLRTAPPEAGLVSFQLRHNPNHSQLVQFLETKGFLLRTIRNPDCARACVHYFTTESEIDQLVQEISDFKS